MDKSGFLLGCSLLVLLLLVVVPWKPAEAWTNRQEVTENPDYPGQCLDERKNRYYKNDETWTVDKICATYICRFPYIQGAGCITVNPRGKCFSVPGNTTEPFPHCCPTVSCETGEEMDNRVNV